jgi:uncharacterized RDD family membrane protein YckC
MTQQSGAESQATAIVERNPYAPSAGVLSGAEPVEPGRAMELASRTRRFLNLLIDLATFFLVVLLIGVAIGLAFAIFRADLQWLVAKPAFIYLVLFFYYFLGEALTGKTVGKWLTRTVVVTESGQPAQWWQLLFRSAYRFVPFDGFSFLSKSRPGWHDKWSNTRVVMDRRL